MKTPFFFVLRACRSFGPTLYIIYNSRPGIESVVCVLSMGFLISPDDRGSWFCLMLMFMHIVMLTYHLNISISNQQQHQINRLMSQWSSLLFNDLPDLGKNIDAVNRTCDAVCEIVLQETISIISKSTLVLELMLKRFRLSVNSLDTWSSCVLQLVAVSRGSIVGHCLLRAFGLLRRTACRRM